MSNPEWEWFPMLETGLYFKTPDGNVHHVTEFKGEVKDETGKSWDIKDCQISRWTQEEIDRAKVKAKRLSKSLLPHEDKTPEDEKPFAYLLKPCCEKEDRGFDGWCKNCGDPCL